MEEAELTGGAASIANTVTQGGGRGDEHQLQDSGCPPGSPLIAVVPEQAP